MTALMVVLIVVVLLGTLFYAGRNAGYNSLRDGLLKDGYDIVIDTSLAPGEGRYMIRIWRSGGWIIVER